MSDGEFPFRSFTIRAEGYDRSEVDAYVRELQSEVTELRRALDAATPQTGEDVRLHDPEGAVTRTLAIAQETADRVLHDAQIEADQRRADANEQAAAMVADAEARSAKMLADVENQTAEVRAQGIAAARAAIQVERDKAIAELGEIRRVRNDIRAEAVELKNVLDTYRSQARDAADALSSAASGPLMSFELPDYVAEDVALAGILEDDELLDGEPNVGQAQPDAPSAVDTAAGTTDDDTPGAGGAYPADEIDQGWSLEGEPMWADDGGEATIAAVPDPDASPPLADVIAITGDADDLPSDLDDADDSGAFLAEVRAAADDTVTVPAEGDPIDDSDRFLSELRGVTESPDADDDIDDEAAGRFFDED